MTDVAIKTLGWIPRYLCIIYILFTAMLSFDVNNILALLLHLIPTFIFILTLIFSWRREWIGAIVFITLPIIFIIWGWGRFNISVYFIMCVPMVLISILYLINWKIRLQVIKLDKHKLKKLDAQNS